MFGDILERLNSAPEIGNASAVSALPIRSLPGWAPAEVPGYSPQPDEPTTVFMITVAPKYFRTIGIQLLRGRDFDETDRTAPARVAIVNRRFADRFFKGRNPVGLTFRVAGRPGDVTVFGAVEDTRLRSFREPERDVVYYRPLRCSRHHHCAAEAGVTAATGAS